MFPIDLIEILFKEIHLVMDIEEDSEISFEVNPLNMHRNSSIEEYFFGLNDRHGSFLPFCIILVCTITWSQVKSQVTLR